MTATAKLSDALETSAPPPRALPLPGGAQLEIDAARELVRFRDPYGREASFEAHPAAREAMDALTCGLSRGGLWFADSRGGAVHFLCAAPPRTRSHYLGERIAGHEQLAIHGLEAGFVLLTENGVSCLDTEGKVRWVHERVTLGWRFERESHGQLFFSDREGDLLAFDAASGEPH